MSSPSAVLLALALELAMGATAAVQPESAAHGARVRRIELRSTTAPGEEPEVLIHPGTSTVLTIDGELARDPKGRLLVELERQAAFTRAEFGETVLRLIPSGALKAGDRLRLTVHFREDTALSEITLLLVVQSEQADRLVEVYREPRPAESYQREVREAWDAVRQCHEALAQARVAPAAPAGLTALRRSSAMGENGIVAWTVSEVAQPMPAGPVLAERMRTYRSASRVLVELSLSPGLRAPPWTADGATLTGNRGETLRVLSVWQDAPATPSRAGWVLVEAEADEVLLSKAWTLRLWEESSGRAFIQTGIAFARLAHQEGGG